MNAIEQAEAEARCRRLINKLPPDVRELSRLTIYQMGWVGHDSLPQIEEYLRSLQTEPDPAWSITLPVHLL